MHVVSVLNPYNSWVRNVPRMLPVGTLDIRESACIQLQSTAFNYIQLHSVASKGCSVFGRLPIATSARFVVSDNVCEVVGRADNAHNTFVHSFDVQAYHEKLPKTGGRSAVVACR